MKISIRAGIILVIAALFLGACLPTVSTPTQEPQIQNTQSSQDVQSEIETAVAQTVEAQNQIGISVTQTLEAQGTATPTATLFDLPTLTPFVIPTSTNVPSSGGSVVKPNYACDVIHVRPYDNSEFRRGQDFDIKWTILNTGTKIWPAGYDLKYYSGPKFTTAGTVQIPELDPGEQFDVVFDAKAPDTLGFHVMTWMVEGQLCYPYIAIIVK